MATDAVLSPMRWTKVSCKTKQTLWQLVFNLGERQGYFLKEATADLHTFGFLGFGPLGIFWGKPLPICTLLGRRCQFWFATHGESTSTGIKKGEGNVSQINAINRGD